jgi:putative membrane protein
MASKPLTPSASVRSLLAATCLLIASSLCAGPLLTTEASPGASRAAAAAKTPPNALVAPGDAAFMQQLASGGLAEIEYGKLAAQRASDPEVRDFAYRMIEDHSRTSDKLNALARPRQVALLRALDPEHASKKQVLKELSGSSFDVVYIDGQVADYHDVLSALRHQIDRAQDRALRELAIDSLRLVSQHLNAARQLQSKLKAVATGTPQSLTRTGRRQDLRMSLMVNRY